MTTRQHAHAFFSSAVVGASRGSPGAEGAARAAAEDDGPGAEEEGPASEEFPPLAPDEVAAAAFSADGGWG